MIKQLLYQYQPVILDSIQNYLQTKGRELSFINKWGPDLCHRLSSLLENGKMIRGCLVLLGHQMFGGKYDEEALKAASALELMHTSILLHDDIMDHDEFRRGQESIHQQYRTLGRRKQILDPHHFGASMGICVGDVGFFMSCQLLTQLNIESSIKEKVFSLFCNEMISVGVAQMQDIYMGALSEEFSEDEILQLYQYKTARYTFALPLLMGATMANARRRVLQDIEQLGLSLGVLFQIKDDELDIFGTETNTGKSVGSDIKEGKKTLYSLYLNRVLASGTHEKTRLGRTATIDKVDTIRTCIEENGIRDKIDKVILKYKNDIQNSIDLLAIDEKYREVLFKLVDYILQRDR